MTANEYIRAEAHTGRLQVFLTRLVFTLDHGAPIRTAPQSLREPELTMNENSEVLLAGFYAPFVVLRNDDFPAFFAFNLIDLFVDFVF